MARVLAAAVPGGVAMVVGLLLLTAPAWAQSAAAGKELVAVLDMDALGASKNQVSAVSERVREEMLTTGRYRLVDRAQMDKVLEEQALQQTGCTSQECAVQVGRILGVRKLITGKVNRVEQDLWLISCTVIDAESAEIVRAVSFQHEGNFASLLASGAPQLVGKLTGVETAAMRAPTRGPTRLADAALQVVNVPPDAEVFMNGASKGKGPQQFNQLAPGTYDLVVRRQGYRPYKSTLNLAPGKAETVMPKLEYPRLAIFPMRRSGTWAPADNEEFTAGWVTQSVKNAAIQAGLAITHTVHTANPRSKNTTGEDLGKDSEIVKGTWSFFGNPDLELAAKKGKQLDVDAVILVSMTTGVTSSTGGWKAYLVDVRNGKSVDDSGTWPYGAGSPPAMTKNLEPMLTKYVQAYR